MVHVVLSATCVKLPQSRLATLARTFFFDSFSANTGSFCEQMNLEVQVRMSDFEIIDGVGGRDLCNGQSKPLCTATIRFPGFANGMNECHEHKEIHRGSSC